MGIDGVGKPPGAGAPPSPAGADRAGPSGPAGEAFKVDKPGRTAATDAAEPLARLERGEIDVNQYLDARVNDAVSHLEGKLAPEQIDFVRDALREQLRTDPVLIELVRRSTGAAPPEG